MRLLILTFLALLPTICHAAFPDPGTTYFKVIDNRSGLPNNSVNAITEDDYGFIWAGTWEGLTRYDGIATETFLHSDTDSTSLCNDMVRAIVTAGNGLFVGTDSGLDYLDFATCRFSHSVLRNPGDGAQSAAVRYTNRVSRLIRSGHYIFGITIDGEIIRADAESFNPKCPVFDIVRSAAPRNADITPFIGGTLLVLNTLGIVQLSPDGTRELRGIKDRRDFDTNLNIHYDSVGRHVFVGEGMGKDAMAYLVGSDGSLRPDPSVSVPPALMATSSTDEWLIFATDGMGLFCQRRGEGFIQFTPDNSSLPGDAIYTAYLDRNRNLWCGTYRRGLCLYSPRLNQYTISNKESGSLSYDIVTAIVPDGDRLYVGLDGGGFDIFDRRSGFHTNISTVNSALPGNNVVSMVKDGDTLWMAVYSHGLVSYNLRTGAIAQYRSDEEKQPGHKLWTIYDSGDGYLWAGGSSLQVFDKASHRFENIDECDLSSIMSIADDGQYIWVATRHLGIVQIHKATRRVVARYSDNVTDPGRLLPAHQIDYIYVDPSGTVWFNIYTRGLYSLAKKGNTRELRHHDSPLGVKSLQVRSIAAAPDGNLWMGTDRGLFLYDRANDIFRRANDSRLPSTFTANCSASLAGTFFFGTLSGILSFDPRNIELDHEPPMPVFTALTPIDNGREAMRLFSHTVSPITLSDSDNFFKISFSVPETVIHEQAVVQYMLTGFDNDWRTADDTSTATYTNVPPGEYDFLVRSRMADGSAWSEPVSMHITVKHPWYLSTSAIILWIILLAVATFLTVRLWSRYISNKRRAQRAELEKEKEAQINKAKLDFYAKMAHELRTPCFLITAQIEELIDNPGSPTHMSGIQTLYRNSLKLNSFINHLIELRKIENGTLDLNCRRVELTSYLSPLEPYFRQLCAQKDITFTYSTDAPPIEGHFDPEKIELIINNLVSNAFKYTRRGGNVALTLRRIDTDTIAINVADDGIGILPENIDRIFHPFFRSQRGRKECQGDGIGLTFVKELVDLMSGTITVTSEVDRGSTFSVILPDKPCQQPADSAEDCAPRRRSLAASAPEETSAIYSNPMATRSMLVVDDNSESARVIARHFSRDFNVDIASDGREGLRMASEGAYSVIITDIMMPELNGLDMAVEIRKLPQLKHTKIAVFSAVDDEEQIVKALDSGVDLFLNKPLSMKVLGAQILHLLDEPDDTLAAPGTGAYSIEDQRFIIECRRYIDEHLLESDFNIKALAAHMAMSHSTLYKRIKTLTGMSVIEFINEYRIYKAINLFHQGHTNVTKVAELCGFSDIKAFRESFKRRMNVLPKNYVISLSQSDRPPHSTQP